MDARHLSPEHLNQRRRRAVELRLAGQTVAQVAAAVELSPPTVMAAHRAFLAGGWDAVAVGRRGRTAGSGRKLAPSVESRLLAAMARALPDELGLAHSLWCDEALGAWLERDQGRAPARRSLARYRAGWGLQVPDRTDPAAPDLARWRRTVLGPLQRLAGPGHECFWTGTAAGTGAGVPPWFVHARDPRGRLYWMACPEPPQAHHFIALWEKLRRERARTLVLVASGFSLERAPGLQEWLAACTPPVYWAQGPGAPGPASASPSSSRTASDPMPQTRSTRTPPAPAGQPGTLTHLQRLEAESIHIMREVVAEAARPVMLYSIGKDSAVMLHLAMKAFHPAVPPFPLLHVDTTWKFRAMYEFRDAMAEKTGMELLVHINQEGLAKGINPFTHGSAIHTDVMKTEGLKQALGKYGFDVAFGGARRDEEKSRAKERIFSFRTAQHRWDPKNQRPELWNLYNARKHPGESIRVFPLSNWTELDIWQYIYLQDIPIVPLYFAAPRPVVERDGTLIMVDDERMPLRPGEVPMIRNVRFRTLGCYPLTGAIESEADSLTAIIQEMLLARTSERQGRVIDHDSAASMERKKQEGYF